MHCIGSAETRDFAVVYHPNNRVETHFKVCGHFCRHAYVYERRLCCVCGRRRMNSCDLCALFYVPPRIVGQ